MSRITEVVAMEDYCLRVCLENGSSLIWNLGSRLKTVRFGRLMDREFFQTATTDGICIRWGNGIEVSVGEMFQLIQK